MTWHYSKPIVSVARGLRKTMTTAEQELWAGLRGRRCGGLRFTRQAPMGPFVLEFYCPAARLAVEADGSIHEDPAVAHRDQEREALLNEVYRVAVLRFPNHEIEVKLSSVLVRIQETARERLDAIEVETVRGRGLPRH